MTVKDLREKLNGLNDETEILLYVKNDFSVLVNNEFDIVINEFLDDDENTITSVYLTSENCVKLP